MAHFKFVQHGQFLFRFLLLSFIWSVLFKDLICVSAVKIRRSSTNEIGAYNSNHNNKNRIHRNITQILDGLLNGYDNSQHPNHKKGRPTTIRTNIYIRSMGPISELDMDYSMECYFRQSWRDRRLRFQGPVDTLSLSIKMLERLWRPDTYFHNGRRSHVHKIILPNKLLRITQEGDILYSMRLTIQAKCPMCLRNFPMDTQSCPLIIGSYAYTSKQIVYAWDHQTNDMAVTFIPGLALSQFDLISHLCGNSTVRRREGREVYSVLQVNFIMGRRTGYFLIQVYLPCVLIVVSSWVGFWINREATSDRVGLGITAVLTQLRIGFDSRKNLPKVDYATALDWFLLMSFGYCMATLLEFAAVHYFTKVESGTIIFSDDEDDEDEEEEEEEEEAEVLCGGESEWEEIAEDAVKDSAPPRQRHSFPPAVASMPQTYCSVRSLQEPEFRAQYELVTSFQDGADSDEEGEPPTTTAPTKLKSVASKQTQTEWKLSTFRQFLKCVLADEEFRRKRRRGACLQSSVNSVSKIDRISRVLFPVSFMILNVVYWVFYMQRSDECPANNMAAWLKKNRK